MSGAGAPEPLDLLWSSGSEPDARLPVEAVYGSALTFPGTRPHVVANFVQTVDGVVAFGERGGNSASTVSMDSAIDRHVMALVRALADAVVVGAGTFRTARSHQWSPGGLVPEAADAFDALRALVRGSAGRAPLYVVTASGRLDPAHAAFTAPETEVAVITTARGAERLEGMLRADVAVLVAADAREIAPERVVELIAERSGGLILCEGGPHLLGDLVRARLVHDLFLTVAPQLAGRDDTIRRLGLVEGFAASPDEAPALRLHSVRRAHEHLFLRYAVPSAG